MTRDDIIRMAREAGVTDGIELPAEGTQRDIVRRCLAGRGYRVLD